MNQKLLQKLSAHEAQHHTLELDLALESHSRWLGQVNHALLFDIAADSRELLEQPHHCQFGRWYEGVDDPVLLAMPEFRALGEVHQRLHIQAHRLLVQREKGEPLSQSGYEQLLEQSEQLRELVIHLRGLFRQNLHLVARLMSKVFENAAEGVIITAPDGTILNVNRAFTGTTGYTPEEAIGKTPNLLYSGRHDTGFYRAMWEQIERQGQWQGEIWNRRKDGELYVEWLSVAAVTDELGRTLNYVGIFYDMTRQRESDERLYHLAHHDLLTGLPNRMLFHDLVRQALMHARRRQEVVAVMFLDLDGFKPVNDSYGHHVGDLLLKQVADRLKTCLRSSDAVGRFGGDEFTVVASDASEKGIQVLAEKIVRLLAEPYPMDGYRCDLSASVGIALYPRDGRSPDLLLRHADIAMYQAKSAGKNRYRLFAPEMETPL